MTAVILGAAHRLSTGTAILITAALALAAAIPGALIGLRIGRNLKASIRHLPHSQQRGAETRHMWRMLVSGAAVLTVAILLVHETPWLWLALMGPAAGMAILLVLRGLPKPRPPDR